MKEKLKELSRDTAIYGISTILSRFLSFILVPFYTQVFRPAEYGIITNVYAFIAFLNVVYLYGMDASYLKYASVKEDNHREIFSTPYLFVLITSIIFSSLFVIFRLPFNDLADIPSENISVSLYVLSILFFDALAVIPFAHLRLLRKAKKFALIKTINIAVNVSLNLILILVYNMGMEAVFISNLAASVLTLILLLPDILANLNLKVDSSILRRMLRFGIPYLPAGLASMIIQVIDRPILLKLTDESTVGIYQANHKLGVFMMLFVSMFQYAWQPFFLNTAKEENAKEIFSKVLTYFILAGSIILVILSLFIEDLIKVKIFGRSIIAEEYWGGLYIIPVILLAYLFNGIYVNFTAGIFIKEKTNMVPYITGAGALANIVINYFLIPSMGMLGSGFAILISYIVMAAGLFIVVSKHYPVNYEYGKIFRIALAVTIVAVLYYTITDLTIAYKFLLLLLFMALLMIFNIINRRELKGISTLILRRKPI